MTRSMTVQLRRALRALTYAWRAGRSKVRLGWQCLLFEGLSVGKGVRIGRRVTLKATVGATLEIADGVEIDDFCVIVSEGSMSIGARTYVGVGTVIVAKDEVTIGEDGLIAAYVTIRDQDHRVGGPGAPHNRQGLVASPVHIAENVWLGTKTTVLRGVEIGCNSVVGANSVVTRSIDANVVAVGAPARPVRTITLSPSDG